MGLGVVFANQLVKWDAKLQVDLDNMLEKAKAANERRYFGINSNPNPFNFDLFLYWFYKYVLLLIRQVNYYIIEISNLGDLCFKINFELLTGHFISPVSPFSLFQNWYQDFVMLVDSQLRKQMIDPGVSTVNLLYLVEL